MIRGTKRKRNTKKVTNCSLFIQILILEPSSDHYPSYDSQIIKESDTKSKNRR